jgi:hypothetical protein
VRVSHKSNVDINGLFEQLDKLELHGLRVSVLLELFKILALQLNHRHICAIYKLSFTHPVLVIFGVESVEDYT